MRNYKCIGAIVFLVLGIMRVDAQTHQALASGGGDASGANGSVSYTIGQMLYTTTTGASGTLASGIQTTLNLGNPLPVELISFGGTCTDGKVQLNWQTAEEVNNDFFEIEKSVDAKAWTSIATINGGNKSGDYSYTDEHPAMPVSYYRLKHVDRDEKFTYSSVIHVIGCVGKAKAITLYPNPTETGVYLAADATENMEYELYDIKGVQLRKSNMQNGTTYIDMSAWAVGTYFLKIRQNKTIINSFSIIKN